MIRIQRSILVGATALLACEAGGNASAGAEASSSAADPSGASTGAATSTASATTSAGATSSDNADTTAAPATGGDGSTTETGVVSRGELRFVALGDAGEGNEDQAAVGQMIATVCAERGCDFALYLGDNFYDVGVSSATDEQFETKFEVPYEPVDLTFHITLGNHDYGTLGNEWVKGGYYVEYSATHEKFSLPSEYYSFTDQNAHFVSLDTNRVFWAHEVDELTSWLHADIAGLSNTWIIMFGHHPYISNGDHGNAGHYEGLGGILGGSHVKDFFEEEVCGKAHVYICGHDHSRQWLSPTCGTEFIVSGAGAKLTELEALDDNPMEFGDDQTQGFLWVEIIDDSFTGVFYDVMGNPQFERTITL